MGVSWADAAMRAKTKQTVVVSRTKRLLMLECLAKPRSKERSVTSPTPVRELRMNRRALIRLDKKFRRHRMASMKTARPFILAFTMGVALTLQAIAETEADAARYGSYPANYKKIVTLWLNKQLIEPNSTRIEWNRDPNT